MKIVAHANTLSHKYTHTTMAGLIDEINLLAIRIPSCVAEGNSEDENHYEDGLKEGLRAVKDIEQHLSKLKRNEPQFDLLRDLVANELKLITDALDRSNIQNLVRPNKQSRIGLAWTKSRAPISRLNVSQGIQTELFS